ncbi:MAG: hypothetical protein IKB49_02460 [Alphaproteobacteria bacterium]|nr:hypothetical protein [Alphaproteobacteria bacterium]
MRKLIGFISCLSLLLNGTIAASATRQSQNTQTRASRARTATQTNSPRTANTQTRRVVARSATKQTNSPRTTNTQSRRVVARAATRTGSTRTHVTPTRNVVARSAVRTTPSTTTAATYTNSYLADILDETTGLITTDAYNSCMKSYYACMDEICTARAPNQGRCGCADRTKSFADAQSAIATATTELIKVSGELTLLLTGDGNDISAAFQLTDAEKVLNCVSWRDASKNGTATAVEFGDWCAEHGIHNGKCSVRTAPSYCYQEFNNFGFDISDLNSGKSDIISALQGWAATKEAAVAIADSKTNNMAGVANGLANITNKPADEIKDSLAETWGYNLLEYAHNNVCARILDNCFNGIYEDCGFPPSYIRTCNNENGCPYNYNSRIALRPDTNEPIIIKPDPTSNPYHKSQCFGYTNTADPYINVRTAVADSRRSIIERYKIDANADCDTFGAALQRTAQNLEYQTQIAKQKLQEFRNDHTDK